MLLILFVMHHIFKKYILFGIIVVIVVYHRPKSQRMSKITNFSGEEKTFHQHNSIICKGFAKGVSPSLLQ